MPLEIGTVHACIAKLPVNEKDAILAGLMVDGDQTPVSKTLQRYLKERDGLDERAAAAASPRTAGTLLRAAGECAEERTRLEAEKCARGKERREQEAAIARAKYLDSFPP